ncbi:hypothetical protein MKW92_048219 [Papaver armeniacum]|nr:hypothetical protein MKW92_048219 [Papaver armeniacum]
MGNTLESIVSRCNVTEQVITRQSPILLEQLYVALSRCTSAGRILVLLPKNSTRHETTNVVYPEVLS